MKHRIREIMKAQGMTIQNLVRVSEVSRRTIQNILSGSDSCHVETLIKLARALNVSTAELLLQLDEKIVKYECISSPFAVETGEEHGLYADAFHRQENGENEENEENEAFRLARAMLELFCVLPPEAQRRFFELYSQRAQEESAESNDLEPW